MLSNVSDKFFNSCEETRLIGEQYYEEGGHLDTALRYTLIVFLGVQFPFIIILNGFSIFLILRFKHLRRTTFFLTLQLLLVDLLDTMFLTPVIIVNALAGKWIMGLPFCTLTGSVVIFDFQMRNLLMFVIVCDRFCTVLKPFDYLRIRRKVILPLNVAALLLPLSSVTAPVILDCMEFSRLAWYCTGQGGCTNQILCRSAAGIVGLISHVLGSYIPLVMYIILFRKARKLRNQVFPNIRMSEENKLRKKNERKANITFLLIFLAVFGVSAIPFLFHFALNIFTGAEIFKSTILPRYIFRLLYYFLPIIDAAAIMRNQDVRKALKMLRNRETGISTTTSTSSET